MSPERDGNPENTQNKLHEAIEGWPKERLRESRERLQKCKQYGPEDLSPDICRVVIVAPGDINRIPYLVQDSCDSTMRHNLILHVNYVDDATDEVEYIENQLSRMRNHLDELGDDLTQPVLLRTEKYNEQQPIQEIRKHATDIALTHFLDQDDNGHPKIMICNDADSRIPADYIEKANKLSQQDPTGPPLPLSGAIKYAIDGMPDLQPVNRMLTSLSQFRQQGGMVHPSNIILPASFYATNKNWGERELAMVRAVREVAPQQADPALTIELDGRRELVTAYRSGQMDGPGNRKFTTGNIDPTRQLSPQELVDIAKRLSAQEVEDVWRRFARRCVFTGIKNEEFTLENPKALKNKLSRLCDASPFELTPAQYDAWRQELFLYGRSELIRNQPQVQRRLSELAITRYLQNTTFE